jgi:thiopeptide-type bacteriocin biosynthesis protein
MVPLVELLDQQVGLGVRETGNLDDAQGKQETANSTSTQMLVQLALAAQQKRQMVVELDEGHLKRLETWRPNAATVPDSVELNVFVVADSADAVDAGRYQLVPGPAVGGQAAGRMFGRFAALFGEEGRTALAATAAHVAERAPQTLLAELVYLPGSGRFCNVAIRPALHRYELVYATSSGVSQENTIPLNELVMGMRGGRLYLRWPQKQVDILPHESHQLSTLGAPTLVRLLSALSMEGCPLLMAFDWREAASFPFLPRVQMGRLVLSLARWRLTALTRERDLPTSSPETFQLALAAWREWWQVPRYVYLSLVDHRLLLDLENPQQRELLRAELQGVQEDSALTLQEVFPPLDQTWVQGPGGQYMTELVVPLTRRSGPRITASLEDAAGRAEAGPSVPARTPPLVISTEQRLKGLGSEWMFVKLYCGKQVQDEVIAGPLRAFARMILQSGFAREWFFLRYADPTPHLRVRFQGDPAVLLSKLLPMLCEWCTSLVTNGPCWKFNFDLYDREIERYGGLEGMELAEGLFGADSRAVADLLALLAPSGPLTLDRKLLAILMMDELLRCLNPDVSARLSWYRQRVKERHLAGQFYRQHSKQLRLLLKAPTPVLEEVPGGTEALSILSAYRQVLVPLGQRLAELEAAGMLAQPRSRLFEGCLHLHCIRLLGLDRGAEEEVVELLLRTLESLLQHAAGDVH